MRFTLHILFVTTALLLSGSDDLYMVADQKLDQIAENRVSRGAIVHLTPAEVNALVRGKIAEEGVEGITNPIATLGEDSATWSGLVDFGRLPQLAKYKNNFLLSSLLKDAKQVEAAIGLISANGQATIDVKHVTIGETRFEGSTLGFLVQQVVLKDYPDAKLGEPFDLEHNVESIKLRSSGITVKIKD